MSCLPRLKMLVMQVLLTGYLVLGYPFMLVRIPPSGTGVPVGSLFLALALLTTNLPAVLSRMGCVVRLAPFLIWWCYGLGRALIDSTDHGLWALRDASQVIDS